MRRREAAISCLGKLSAVSWTVVSVALLVSFGTIEAEGAKKPPIYALTVTTAEALREAFLNRNVSLIYLGDDIKLSRDVWVDGRSPEPETGIVVKRNLTLTTHPSHGAPAVLYLDYMQSRVLVGPGAFLTINGVVMKGVSLDARNYFFVPFFDFRRGGTILIQNSQYQLAIDPVTLWPLEEYPSRMNSTARPEGFEEWPVQARVISDRECEEHHLREVSCKDGAIWVGSLAARLTVFNEEVHPVGKAAFLARNVLMIASATRKGPSRERRVVTISTPQEFKKALQNPLVAEILISKDLNLTEDIFPPSSRTPITRNLTMLTSRQLNRSAVINFNYLQSAVVAGADVIITLMDLTFVQVSKDPIDFELVPFFSLQSGAMYVYRNIVSEMALSPGEVYPLNQLPYALYGGDVPESYIGVVNDVSVVSPRWCEKDGRIKCPDGALWITRGIRRLQVLGSYNQEPGAGFIDIQNSLIKTIDVTKKDFNQPVAVPSTRTEDKKNRESDKKVQTQSSSSSSSSTEDKEERRSFGFIGGFDPWILIYALVAAAMILGLCLFVTILRRRREQRTYRNTSTLKSDGSFTGGEDDGIDVHQKVARQLLGDVKLGTLLGCGSFGRVYKAMWTGAQVAVKVILHQEDEAEVEQEAQFSISLRHPNVVQTFHYAVRTVETATPTPKQHGGAAAALAAGDGDGCVVNIQCKPASSVPVQVGKGMNLPSNWMKTSNGGEMFSRTAMTASAQSSAIRTENQSEDCFTEERWLEMWLIQEFCNLGSLGKQNYLRINDQNSAWGCKNPGMHVIVDTCKDIARGMKYLHDNGIVHGDLKCDNLLLQSSHVTQKGFIAKVADFGLSRKLGMSTHLSTKSFGTITHMPPELLIDGHLSSKVDVYSFGVIMWELVTGLTPFRDLRYAEVMRAIVVDDKRPVFDPETQEDYVALAKRCWDKDPTKRPSFGAVLMELDKIANTADTRSVELESTGPRENASGCSTPSNKGYSA